MTESLIITMQSFNASLFIDISISFGSKLIRYLFSLTWVFLKTLLRETRDYLFILKGVKLQWTCQYWYFYRRSYWTIADLTGIWWIEVGFFRLGFGKCICSVSVVWSKNSFWFVHRPTEPKWNSWDKQWMMLIITRFVYLFSFASSESIRQ